ncbi:MAG: S24 family peptidase [Candidatus Sulfotelmatobacter sp.]
MNRCSNDDVVSAKRELAEEVLRSFGSLRFAATGWSMLPAVRSGDTLVIDRVTPNQIQVGDIALIGRDGRLCAHRVVRLPRGLDDRVWITQGDAMPAPDQPVIEDELLGRVTKIIRAGKYITVSRNLRGIDFLLAQIVRRSVFAARLFVYWTSRRNPEKVESLCQG